MATSTTVIKAAISYLKATLGREGEIVPPFGRVLLAKTTQLGDLVISLPMASALKRRDPHCTVILLTNKHTMDAARYCPDVDEVYAEPETAEELRTLLVSLRVDIFVQVNTCWTLANAAFEAGIPVRIGSLFRSYNWTRCTHLVTLSSPGRGLNKRLLDLQFLGPLGIHIDDVQVVRDLYRLSPPRLIADQFAFHPAHFSAGRWTVILCPALVTAKSHQWPLASYSRLIRALDADKFHWFICGTPADRQDLQPLLNSHFQEANVTDLVGKLSLAEFISFIAHCDALVAGSTGPLHVAAALGIHTLGLFQARKVDVQRWHPVGRSTAVIHSKVRCQGERRNVSDSQPIPCPCIVAIEPDEVVLRVRAWFENAVPCSVARQSARRA